MMIVKACRTMGVWELYEAHNVAFLANRFHIEVEVDEHGDINPWAADPTIPKTDYAHLIVGDESEYDSKKRFFRWVSWMDRDGETHCLVTDKIVYICNENGKTVERLSNRG